MIGSGRRRPAAHPVLAHRREGWLFVGLGLALLVALTLFFRTGPIGGTRPQSVFAKTSAAACRQRGADFVYEQPFCIPATWAGCAAVGGFWGSLGASSGEGCNAVMPDAGARCRDGQSCVSGHCLAVLEPDVVQRLSQPGAAVDVDGLCAGLARVRGCNADVSNGRAAAVRCQR